MIYSKGKPIGTYSVHTYELPLENKGLAEENGTLVVKDASKYSAYTIADGNKEASVNILTRADINLNCDEVNLYYSGGEINAENLVAENIVKGVSILGVEGNFEGGGSGTDYLAMRLSGTPYEYSNSEITSLPQYAFYYDKGITKISLPNVTSVIDYSFQECTYLTSANLLNATSIGYRAFLNCYNLTSVSLQNVTSISGSAFSGCYSLTSIDLPNVTSIGSETFNNCENLTSANLPLVPTISSKTFYCCYRLLSIYIPLATSISSQAFYNCRSLRALIITQTDSVATLSSTDAFKYCHHILGTQHSTYNPNSLKDGYIYVNDNMLDQYKSATNWSTYADSIKPLSELPQEYKDLYGIE